MAGLRALFNEDDIRRMIDRWADKKDEKIIALLKYGGEKFVREARLNGNYRDITGNLRSSIGYAIVKDGSLIAVSISPAGKGSDRNTGVTNGKRLMKNLADEYSSGWVLIGVAGMDYAVHVENVGGKDVISSSVVGTEKFLRDTMRKALA